MFKAMFHVRNTKDWYQHECATCAEIEAFETDPTGPYAPDVSQLRLDPFGGRSSPWNVRTKELVLQAVKAKHEEEGGPPRPDDYWRHHIGTMHDSACSEWRRPTRRRLDHLGREETDAEVRQRMDAFIDATRTTERRRNRRRYKYTTRMETTTLNIKLMENRGNPNVWAWKWTLEVLTALTYEGMSSDETDPEHPISVRIVKKLPWRRDVTALMEHLDIQKETNSSLYDPRGAKAVKRKRGDAREDSSRKPVNNLPYVLYSPRWLASGSYLSELITPGGSNLLWHEMNIVTAATGNVVTQAR